MIDAYQGAVDDSVVSFVEKVRNLKNRDYRNKIKLPIAEVSARAASDLYQLTGVDTTGFEHVLTGRAVNHIDRRHGANGEADHSMQDVNDIGRIGYVLENYDTVAILRNQKGDPVKSMDFMNADDTPGQAVQFTKKVNGTYYVVEAVTDTKAQQVGIVSAYMQKNSGSADQVLNMPDQNQTRSHTPEAPHGAYAPTTSDIAQTADGVNGKNGETKDGGSNAAVEKPIQARYKPTGETVTVTGVRYTPGHEKSVSVYVKGESGEARTVTQGELELDPATEALIEGAREYGWEEAEQTGQ